jgi:hypothetical protein
MQKPKPVGLKRIQHTPILFFGWIAIRGLMSLLSGYKRIKSCVWRFKEALHKSSSRVPAAKAALQAKGLWPD